MWWLWWVGVVGVVVAALLIAFWWTAAGARVSA